MNSLTKKEIFDVIEGKGCAERIPMMYNMWITLNNHKEIKDDILKIFDEYPNDVDYVNLALPTMYMTDENPDFSWIKRKAPVYEKSVGHDARMSLPDWDDLEDALSKFPNAYDKNICSPKEENPDQYVVARWGYCFFERLWSFRGMENALVDFFLYPDEVHRFFQWYTDFYMDLIQRAKDELHADAVFTTDDIGTQNSTFFSLELFREFFKPYYKQLIDKAHSLGMHFWLHTCGNIELFLPEFIEIGLDVIHPIQKYTMDQKQIADKYGKDICILAGFDVQQVIPFGTEEDVRKEVRGMMDTYGRPEGRLMMTTGNGSTPDWKLYSFQGLFDESFKYGKIKADELKSK